MPWNWRYETAAGRPAANSLPEETFTTQSDAESWLGENWRGLLDQGVDQVTLYEDDQLVYGPMSLHPRRRRSARERGTRRRHDDHGGHRARVNGGADGQGRRGGLAVLAGSRTTVSPSTSSMRSTSSASSSNPAALTLSRICSGLLAPMIAADTFELRSTQASAS